MDSSTPFNGDLTLKELKTAISGLGSASKAAGEDPISCHLTRRFPESMTEILLDFYQTCWESGTIPVAWKDALVIAIPKEGKPRHLPTSYRPIALTPHLGKVYERLIKNRLEYLLEKQGILPVCQAGFRKGRNCMEHVIRLSEHVKKKPLRAAVRLSPPSLTLREPLTQSGTPSTLTRCRLWASRADCTNSCKRSWTPDGWQ